MDNIASLFSECTTVMKMRAKRSKLLREYPESKREINKIFNQLLELKRHNADNVHSSANSLANRVIEIKSVSAPSAESTWFNPVTGELEILRPVYACPILSEYYVMGTPLAEKHFKLKEQQPPNTILCTLLDNWGCLGIV